MATVPVNLYGESHIVLPPKSDKPEPLTDPFLLVQILQTKDHPAVNLLNGTEYNPKNPARTGFHKERKISVGELLSRLRANERFLYNLSQNQKRVRWVRSIRWRKTELGPFEACYRTVGSATLPPSPEWCREMNRNTDFGANSMIWRKVQRRIL